MVSRYNKSTGVSTFHGLRRRCWQDLLVGANRALAPNLGPDKLIKPESQKNRPSLVQECCQIGASRVDIFDSRLSAISILKSTTLES